nr:zinc finger MYM-type protein 1-like [Onthophagus taurus]
MTLPVLPLVPQVPRMKKNTEIEIDNVSSTSSINLHDPSTWPAIINNRLLEILVEKGPPSIQQNIKFPTNTDSDGRSFSPSQYFRILPNGEKIERKWLVYSLKANSTFCYCCKLFSIKSMKLTGKDGFSDWRHLATQLSRHESSIDHMFNYQKWNELKKRLSKNCTIDCEQQRYFESEKRRWRDIITRIVAIVQYLAGQCLAFRGDSDVLYERNNGNFLKGIEMLAKFDPIISNHINNIQKNCTPDVTHVEQISFVARIVDMSTSPIEIKELFLGFYPVLDATGEGLFNFFTNELLSTYDLDVQNIHGQGYDNGSKRKLQQML